MQAKHIEKLEELKGYEWNFNKKKFKLEKSYMVGATVVLHMLNNKENTNGEEEDKAVFWVNEKNYKELEFYGLKVVLNEKPKLAEKEWDILECIDEDIWIARNKDGTIVVFTGIPEVNKMQWAVSFPYSAISLCPEMYPFITWESGKAWSKSELMELEVVE